MLRPCSWAAVLSVMFCSGRLGSCFSPSVSSSHLPLVGQRKLDRMPATASPGSANRLLRQDAPNAAIRASLDFDSIRTSLRWAIQFAAAGGSVAVLGQALSSTLRKSGGEQNTLDLEAVQRCAHAQMDKRKHQNVHTNTHTHMNIRTSPLTGSCSFAAGSLSPLNHTSALAETARFYNSLTATQLQQLFWCIFLDTAGAAPELLLPGPLGAQSQKYPFY